MTHLQCPQCQKGLLWGIFLDIPAEIKNGLAEWVACEPPESDTRVKCPSCGQEAGTYGELYAASADNRRFEKNQKKAEQLELIRITELPSYRLFGAIETGNVQRESFLKECWENHFAFVQGLKKNRLLPRPTPEAPSLPASIGVRLDDPDEVGLTQCRYLATIALPQEAEKSEERLQNRLANPEYLDPKNFRIEIIPAGLYAQYPLQGKPEEFFQIHKFLKKEWLTNNPYELRQGPFLEIYTDPLSSWPPEKEEFIDVLLCLPIQPKIPFSEES